MTDDISYTPEEVAKILKISRFTVYELIKRGDLTAYRIGRKVRVEAADIENYKQKAKGIAQGMLGTTHKEEVGPKPDGNIIICGQDVILDILTRSMERKLPQNRFLRNYAGSIDGLLALYRGQVNVVTAHLWDSDTDQYNLPFIRRLLPGQKTVVINLVYRMEGFYVAKGNPKGIKDWADMTRTDVVYINRERGSGARVLLDEKIYILGLDKGLINGYDQEESSHLAVASRVARGEADMGLGIEKAAMQVNGVDFVPIHKERYDLVVLHEDMDKLYFKTMLEILRNKEFQQEVEGLGGYDISQMGQIIGQ